MHPTDDLNLLELAGLPAETPVTLFTPFMPFAPAYRAHAGCALAGVRHQPLAPNEHIRLYRAGPMEKCSGCFQYLLPRS